MTSPKVVSPSGAATSRNTRILLLQDYRCRAFEHFSVLRPASKWPSSRTARRTGAGSLPYREARNGRTFSANAKARTKSANKTPLHQQKSPRNLMIAREDGSPRLSILFGILNVFILINLLFLKDKPSDHALLVGKPYKFPLRLLGRYLAKLVDQDDP